MVNILLIAKRLLSLVPILMLGACHAISTNDQYTTNTAFPDTPPNLIIVRDFENDRVTLRRDARDSDLPQQIIRQISAGLDQGLKAANLDTRQLPPDQSVGDEGWVVTGRLRLVQWSTGNDSSTTTDDDRIECTVYVYDVSKSRVQPFLTFDVITPRLAGDAANEQSAPATDSASSLQATCDALSQIIVQRVQDYIGQNF